jgi:GDP-D-mannose 3', 5'-epimerase
MQFKGYRILVTGGAGFIGSSLVKRLLKEGADVSVIDNLWRGKLENLKFNNNIHFDLSQQFHLVDLTDFGKCLEIIRNSDIVYHLADVVAGIDFVINHEPFVFRQNILINTNVLWACIINNVPNYVYVGTACSYPKKLQMSNGINALKEKHTYPAEPESAYGWSKLMGEYEAELAMKNHQANIGVLRFHNVYGPGVSFEPGRSQALPDLARKAILFPNEEFIVWGSGNQYRDFVYIDDVVEALLLVFFKGMNKGLIQIGSGKATTLKDAAEMIVKLSGKSIEVHYELSRPEGDHGRIGICSRAEQILGWKAKVDFNIGLEKMFRWIQQQIEMKSKNQDLTCEKTDLS